jgi:hypothetical protein
MTIGSVTYNPSPTFGLMRSYLPQITVSGVLGTPTVLGNHVFWINQHGSGQDYHIIFNPLFWAYGRGRWFMNEVIDECYYQVPPSPTKNGVDFEWRYVGVANILGSSVLWIPYGSLTTPISVPLLGESQPYWWNGSDV